MELQITKWLKKYHHIMWCIIVLLPQLAQAAQPPAFLLQPAPMPQFEGVRSFLQRSQLPAHLKDVLENILLKGQFFQAGVDFDFGGTDQPVDWHIDPKTRRVYGHVDLGSGAITIYPGFYGLKPKKQVEMLVHMGLHLLQGLGLSRISEPTIRQLSDMLVKDQELKTDHERREMRAQLRRFVDHRWAVGKEGTVFLSPGLADQLLPPWPFDRKKTEAKHGN